MDGAAVAEKVWQGLCQAAAEHADIPEPLAAAILEAGGFWQRCWYPKHLNGPKEVLAASDALYDDAVAFVLDAVAAQGRAS
jgi:hypothetical protein